MRKFRTHGDFADAFSREGGRVAQSTVSKWETGAQVPGKRVHEICKILGVPYGYVMYGEGDPFVGPHPTLTAFLAKHNPPQEARDYLLSQRGLAEPDESTWLTLLAVFMSANRPKAPASPAAARTIVERELDAAAEADGLLPEVPTRLRKPPATIDIRRRAVEIEAPKKKPRG